MRTLNGHYAPETLAFSVWLTGELNQHDNSCAVDLEQLLGKLVQKKAEGGLGDAEMAEGIDACMNLTGLYGCCVLVKLAAYIIDGKKEANQSLAHYIITSALYFLNARAKKGPMTEMDVEFAKFVLSIADQVRFSPFATRSLDELKEAVGYGG